MRQITDRNRQISTILAFSLIPFSGLATDVYLPAFPEMEHVFHSSPTGIQETLVFFLVSYGIAQIFAGSILDAVGRYRLTLISLFLFIISNFIIIITRHLELVYLMRSIQGLCIAFIMVSKRAFFVDVYSGEKQRHYTSLLTIVWSTAPIIAPFMGGYLQTHFAWTSNFYLLGIYGLVMFLLELLYSGESLRLAQPFQLRATLNNYRKLMSSIDFTAGVLVLGSLFSMVMLFNMAIPFIVEKQFHLPPVITGYCALLSGIALFIGGFLGKIMKYGSLFKQLILGNIVHYGLIFLMFISASFLSNIVVLMTFVILIHMVGGIIFNRFFTYCVTRFPENAGMASGIVGGGLYVFTSLATTGVLGIITVSGQHSLATCYLFFSLIITGILVSLKYLPSTKLSHA